MPTDANQPIFTDNPSIQMEFCSYNVCGQGHKWKPTIALAECPVCKTPSLMVKMENCPFCNEPVETLSLRSDHIPGGAGIIPRCKGVKPFGDTIDIVLKRNHFSELEDKRVEKA